MKYLEILFFATLTAATTNAFANPTLNVNQLDGIITKGLPGNCTITNLGQTLYTDYYNGLEANYNIAVDGKTDMNHLRFATISNVATTIADHTVNGVETIQLDSVSACNSGMDGVSCQGYEVTQVRLVIQNAKVVSFDTWFAMNAPANFTDTDLWNNLSCK
jgi:hypothetical protein